MGKIVYQTLMDCPVCSDRKYINMPEGSKVNSYRCDNCNTTIETKEGDCCVFCSYGRVPCPETQKKLVEK